MSEMKINILGHESLNFQRFNGKISERRSRGSHSKDELSIKHESTLPTETIHEPYLQSDSLQKLLGYKKHDYKMILPHPLPVGRHSTISAKGSRSRRASEAPFQKSKKNNSLLLRADEEKTSTHTRDLVSNQNNPQPKIKTEIPEMLQAYHEYVSDQNKASLHYYADPGEGHSCTSVYSFNHRSSDSAEALVDNGQTNVYNHGPNASTWNGQMIRHLPTQSSDKIFARDHCNKGFKGNYDEKAQEQMNSPQEAFSCQYCNKCFPTRYKKYYHKCDRARERFSLSLRGHEEKISTRVRDDANRKNPQPKIKKEIPEMLQAYHEYVADQNEALDNDSSPTCSASLHSTEPGESHSHTTDYSFIQKSSDSAEILIANGQTNALPWDGQRIRHLPTQSKGKIFTSDGKGFKENYGEKAQEQMNSPQKAFSCQHCNKCFSTRYKKNYHKCDRARERFSSLLRADEGKTSNHIRDGVANQKNPQPKTKKEIPEMLQAYHGYMADQNEALDSISCPPCSASLHSADPGESHSRTSDYSFVQKSSDTAETLIANGQTIACNHCPNALTWNGQTIRHLPTQSDGKIFTCAHCDTGFKENYDEQAQEQMHGPQKAFKCQYCNKCFSTRYKKSYHNCDRARERFSCEHCSKTFLRVSEKNRHARIHTGEKPYKCRFCDKFFRESYNRIAHEKIHKRQKPFKCECCSECFATDYKLKCHERTHAQPKA